jgi:hypothetical protein
MLFVVFPVHFLVEVFYHPTGHSGSLETPQLERRGDGRLRNVDLIKYIQQLSVISTCSLV